MWRKEAFSLRKAVAPQAPRLLTGLGSHGNGDRPVVAIRPDVLQRPKSVRPCRRLPLYASARLTRWTAGEMDFVDSRSVTPIGSQKITDWEGRRFISASSASAARKPTSLKSGLMLESGGEAFSHSSSSSSTPRMAICSGIFRCALRQALITSMARVSQATITDAGLGSPLSHLTSAVLSGARSESLSCSGDVNT